MPGSWTTVDLGGHAADVYQPAAATRPRFAVLFLHPISGETLVDRPVFTSHFDALNVPCICPHGGYTWWTDRISPEFDPQLTSERLLLDHVVPHIRERWQVTPPAIGLLGISMGGQAVLRLAFKQPKLFPVVAAIAPALDYYELYGQGLSLDAMYDSKEQCRQDTALMYVPPYHPPPHIFYCIDPDDRQWVRGADRLHEKLSALGVPHEMDTVTRAGGHSWDYFNHQAERAIRFLHAGLELESRRLL